MQVKKQRLKLAPLPMPKRAVSILISLDDESFLKETKQWVKEEDSESIVFRDKIDSINANYKITYRNDDKDSEYVLDEIYIAEYLCNESSIHFSQINF